MGSLALQGGREAPTLRQVVGEGMVCVVGRPESLLCEQQLSFIARRIPARPGVPHSVPTGLMAEDFCPVGTGPAPSWY